MLKTTVGHGAGRLTKFMLDEDDPASLVRARFRRSGYPFLQGIRCEMRDDALVLAGTVPTFHLKQIAQELAAHTRGVAKVENRLQVTNRPSRREN